MILTIRMFYYSINSVDNQLDGEMVVKYATCLLEISNAKIQHKCESARIIKSAIESAMATMDDTEAANDLKGLVGTLLNEKVSELESAAPLNGRVWYDDTRIDLAETSTHESLLQVTENIEQVSKFKIFQLAGNEAGNADLANMLLEKSADKFAEARLTELNFYNWKHSVV